MTSAGVPGKLNSVNCVGSPGLGARRGRAESLRTSWAETANPACAGTGGYDELDGGGGLGVGLGLNGDVSRANANAVAAAGPRQASGASSSRYGANG